MGNLIIINAIKVKLKYIKINSLNSLNVCG